MKKSMLLFSAFLLFVASVSAQPFVYTATVQSDPAILQSLYDVPLCGWGQNYAVSYVVDGTNRYFCLIDYSDFHTTIPSVPIPPGTPSAPICPIYHALIQHPANMGSLVVNDIFVVDDYAFFCGSIYDGTLMVTLPIWGYFDINDFFTTSLSITFCALFSGLTTPPKYLEKLVAYNLNGQYDVVAYGHDDTDAKVVEIKDVLGGTLTSSCNVANLFYYIGYEVGICDIVLTDSYVVFITRYNNGFVGYCWGTKGLVVSELSTLSNRNIFLSVSEEANGLMTGVALPNDQFAMAYVHVDGYDVKSTRLRVFDIATETNSRSYEFAKPEKEDPVKMVYLHKQGTIELMQPILDSMDYIQLDPYTTASYSTTIFIPDHRVYCDMDRVDGNRFISTSGMRYYLQDRSAPLPPSNDSCPDHPNHSVYLISNVITSPIPQAIHNDNITHFFSMYATPIGKEKLGSECFSFGQKSKTNNNK